MEFSPEFWANHKRGMKKRAEISNYLSKNPTASIELIAVTVNLSTRQVRRHLNTIRLERSASSIAIASAFVICLFLQAGNWLINQCGIDQLDSEIVAVNRFSGKKISL
jgi:hypothetical protein